MFKKETNKKKIAFIVAFRVPLADYFQGLE